MAAINALILQGELIEHPTLASGERGLRINDTVVSDVVSQQGGMFSAQGPADEIRDMDVETAIVDAAGDLFPNDTPEASSVLFSGAATRPRAASPVEIDMDEITSRLNRAQVSFDVDEQYGDITVPAGEGWGYIVAANMSERTSREEAEAVDERAQSMQEFIDDNMASGILTSIESGRIRAFSAERSERILSTLGNKPGAPEAKRIAAGFVQQTFSSKLARDRSMAQIGLSPDDVGAAGPPPLVGEKTAVILQPHLTWQVGETGGQSRFPQMAKPLLEDFGFGVASYFYDDQVTLELWRDTLSEAQREQTTVLYNQGHGSYGKIYEGTIHWQDNLVGMRYFSAQFVRDHAALPDSLAYIYSCNSDEDPDFKQAFFSGGAKTYCGWQNLAVAYGKPCDKFDETFWQKLLDGGTVGDGMSALTKAKIAKVKGYWGESEFRMTGDAGFTL